MRDSGTTVQQASSEVAPSLLLLASIAQVMELLDLSEGRLEVGKHQTVRLRSTNAELLGPHLPLTFVALCWIHYLMANVSITKQDYYQAVGWPLVSNSNSRRHYRLLVELFSMLHGFFTYILFRPSADAASLVLGR